jgi:hypothetical protein
MIRNILSVPAGLVAAFIFISLLHKAGHFFYSPPAGLDINNKFQVEAFLHSAPIGAMLFLLFSYFLGSVAGGIVTAKTAGKKYIIPVIITGALLTAAGVMNLYMISHPLWFTVSSLLVYIPGTWLGGKIIQKSL